MLPIWLLAAMMIMMYYWRFWEPWANAMLATLLPKLWIENHDWHNCFCMSSWCSPLLDPKKLQNEQFYIIDWIRKNSWSMLPIWLLAAMMIMMYYWRFWEPWANAMLAILLPKLCFGVFLHVFLGLTLTGPKKASKRTVLHNRLNKEKLLVDVANLAPCCYDDYDVLLEVLGTLGKYGLGALGRLVIQSPTCLHLCPTCLLLTCISHDVPGEHPPSSTGQAETRNNDQAKRETSCTSSTCPKKRARGRQEHQQKIPKSKQRRAGKGKSTGNLSLEKRDQKRDQNEMQTRSEPWQQQTLGK